MVGVDDSSIQAGSRLAWCEGWQPFGAVDSLSDKPGKH